MTDLNESTEGLSRRTVMKGAAWSVPVLALAVAAPLASASNLTEVNGYQVNGTCGALGLGLLGAGFTVAAGADPIPAQSTIVISGDGLVNLQALSWSGGLLSGGVLSGSTLTYTFLSDLPANTTTSLTSLADVNLFADTTATLSLPSTHTPGTGTKPTGTYENAALILCSAS